MESLLIIGDEDDDSDLDKFEKFVTAKLPFSLLKLFSLLLLNSTVDEAIGCL